jgi:hypothetical protein
MRNCIRKHAPFVVFILLAPFSVVVTFNDVAFKHAYRLVSAGPRGVAIVSAVVLAWVDYRILDWVLRTKFLCGCFRKFPGIALYWVISVFSITACMHLAASLNAASLGITTFTGGRQWPGWDVLSAEVLIALLFVVFYDSLLKLASPAFSKLDYTVFHSAVNQMIAIIDDCQGDEPDIEKPEYRERIRSHLLSLVTQAHTCLENNELLETDQSERECIRVVLKDLQELANGLRELEGPSLTKQQLQWQIWGCRPGLGESERNRRFRQLRKGECPC